MRSRFIGLVFLMVLLCIQAAFAQDDVCPDIVDAALQAAEEMCEDTGRNQACYGNVALEAEAQDGVEGFSFEQAGDIENVSDIQSLRLAGLNEETQDWGVVLMRLQANLPDTLPGQSVTFILFGDVELTNAVTGEQVENGELTPMQAFYFTSGIGEVNCKTPPENGILVQTPEGVGEVNFVVNEVEVQMGSTVLFRAQREGEMKVSTLEGAAALKVDGEFFPVIEGTWVTFAIDENLRPTARPSMPETYTEAALQRLPLGLLDREIDAREPLTEEEIEQVHERINAGEPLCGDDGPFPTCDHLPSIIGGLPCVLPDRDGRRPAGISNRRPLCEAAD